MSEAFETKKLTSVDNTEEYDSVFVKHNDKVMQVPKEKFAGGAPGGSNNILSFEHDGKGNVTMHNRVGIAPVIGYGTELPSTGSEGDVFILINKAKE